MRKETYYRVWPLITQNKSKCTSKNMNNQIPNNNRLFAKNLGKKYRGCLVSCDNLIEVYYRETIIIFVQNGAEKTIIFCVVMNVSWVVLVRFCWIMKESIFIPDFKRAKVDMGYITQENNIFERRAVLRGLVEVSEYLKIYSEKKKFPGP